EELESVLQVQIDRIELIQIAWIVAPRSIVVQAHAPACVLVDLTCPTPEKMTAADVDPKRPRRTWTSDHRDRRCDLPDLAVVGGALEHELIATCERVVGAKANLAEAPVIVALRVRMFGAIALGILAEYPKEATLC